MMDTILKNISGFLKYVAEGTEMTYNSLIFFLCLLIFLGIYFLLPRPGAKRIWILAANFVFYTWSGRDALMIVAATALVVYAASLRMGAVYRRYDREKEGLTPKEQTVLFASYKKKTRRTLWLGLALILGVWLCVKGAKLLGMESVDSFSDCVSGRGILIPLGISYYTLSAVGYLLDVYWRRAKPERRILRLFTVMTYFPHIVQGPISKYSRLLSRLDELPGFNYQRVCFGLQRMLWGYFKKLVVADRLVIYTGAVFGAPEDFAGIEILLAVVLGVFQLYADFSGCMDIVGGISQALGIELDENFRQPLFSGSAAEFWTRWHITLGAWTKEYLYLPIAMNPRFMKKLRKLKKDGKPWLSSFLKAFCPLIAVWLFTGLWHGTGWDYIVWGMYWCLLMTLSKETASIVGRLTTALKIDTGRKYHTLWQQIRTFFLFGIGRTFTVTGSLTGFLVLWQQIRTFFLFGIGRTFTVTGSLSGFLVLWRQFFAEFRLWVLFDGSLYEHGLDQKDFTVAIVGIVLMLAADLLHERGVMIRQGIAAQPLPLRWIVYYGAMFSIVIFGIYGSGYDAASFVYGAF